jgi:transporter family protein
MEAFIFAILAAICWGLAPVAAKVALDQVSPLFALGVRSALATAMVTLWLELSGNQRPAIPLTTREVSWLVIEAVLATVVGDALYFYALRHGRAVQVGLVMACSPLITVLAASLLLDEPLTPLKVLGAAVTVIGLILVSL